MATLSKFTLSNSAQSVIVFVGLLLVAVGGLEASYGGNTMIGEVLAILGIFGIAIKDSIPASSAVATGLTNAQQSLLTIIGISTFAVGSVAVPLGAPMYIGLALQVSGAVGLAIKEWLGTWSNPTNLPNSAQSIVTFMSIGLLGFGQLTVATNSTHWPTALAAGIAGAVGLALKEYINPPSAIASSPASISVTNTPVSTTPSSTSGTTTTVSSSAK